MISKKNKEVQRPKEPSEEKIIAPKTRILTAEGWKRAQLKKRGKK